MLQVSLAPAPVAHRDVRERRRSFLVAARKFRHHVYGPAAAPDQSGLDEVVTQDVAAERRAPAQVRQTGLLGERPRADDGIVAPVVAFGAVPPGDAVRD